MCARVLKRTCVPVAADKTLGVALADYDNAPALLTDVRAEQLGTH